MAKIRVHELASELGVAATVLDRLNSLGENVKSPSSIIDAPVAAKVGATFGARTPRPTPRPSPVRSDHVDPYVNSPAFDRRAVVTSTWVARGRRSRAARHPDLLKNIQKSRQRSRAFGDHLDVSAAREL